jgi:Kef-type K+ transport system membrane component KefB
VQIGGAVFLGSLFGTIFNWVGDFVRRDTEGVFIVLVFGLLTLCFGTASMIGVDQLLSTMTLGVIVINFNRQGEMIFKMLERYTEELIFVLFFTLSGMHLDFSVLSKSMLIVLIFFILRTIGKVSGCMLGASIAHSSDKVKKYTAGGLIPQGGIVVGLALIMKQNPAFHEFADIILV